MNNKGEYIMAKNMPEFSVKVGGIQFTVWSNTRDNKEFKSVVINKAYKDKKNGEYKTTTNFTPTDIGKLQHGLTKVMDYLYCKPVIKPEVVEGNSDVPF